jgi:hypothetical protein
MDRAPVRQIELACGGSSSPVAAAARSPDPGPGSVRTVGFFLFFCFLNLFLEAGKATASINLH